MYDKKYEDWYKAHHGLHVLDNRYIKGCQMCKDRHTLEAIVRMKGLDPKRVVSDAKMAGKLSRKRGNNE